MTIVEKFTAFLTRKRNWKWIAAGLAVALVGHFLEGVPIISRFQGFTLWVQMSLQAVQPFAIADAFLDATRGHRGLWFCAPIGSLSESNRCGSVIGIANIALASLFALPHVAATVWATGGLISTILFLLTLLAMLLFIIGVWRDIDTPDGGAGKAMLGTITILALGPLGAGAIFWVLLQFLLLLAVIFGSVLAGMAWCVATFGTIYKVGAFLFGAVKSGDDLQENAVLLAGKDDAPQP